MHNFFRLDGCYDTRGMNEGGDIYIVNFHHTEMSKVNQTTHLRNYWFFQRSVTETLVASDKCSHLSDNPYDHLPPIH